MGSTTRKATGEAEGHKNARARYDTTDANTKRLMAILAKLCLKNAQRIGILNSILLQCYLVATAAPFVEVVKAGTARWQEKVNQVGKNATDARKTRTALGQPHAHAYNSFIAWLKDNTTEAVKNAIHQYITLYDQHATPEKKLIAIQEEVKYFRLLKSHQEKFRRLEVSFVASSASDQLWKQVVHPYLITMGAEELAGVAPKSNMEREIHKWLDGEAGGGGGACASCECKY